MKVYPLDNYLHGLKIKRDAKIVEIKILEREVELLSKIIDDTEKAHGDFKKLNENGV